MGAVLAFLGALLVLAFLTEIEAGLVFGLVAGGLATALIGFFDDRRSQPAVVRFGVHLAASVCVFLSIGGISERALGSWGLHGAWIAGLVTVMMLAWATNLFNFMDGIDGIAASESVFMCAAGAWINWHQAGDVGLTAAFLFLAAASLGFLYWNWPPARIFMGDVGSGFLGFSIAALGLAASRSAAVPIEVWAILGGVFVVDATTTLLRRIARGDRWIEAHRMHAYQHLARRWRAHLPVTVWVIVIDVVWLLPWATFAAKDPALAPWSLAGALVPLVFIALACGAGAKEK